MKEFILSVAYMWNEDKWLCLALLLFMFGNAALAISTTLQLFGY